MVNKIKKIFKIINLSLAVSICFLTGFYYNEINRALSSKEELSKLINEMNHSQPQVMDDRLQLIKVDSENKKIIFNYIFPEEIQNESKFKEDTIPILRDKYCLGDSGKFFREKEISVDYRYSGIDGLLMGNVLVSPEDCVKKGVVKIKKDSSES